MRDFPLSDHNRRSRAKDYRKANDSINLIHLQVGDFAHLREYLSALQPYRIAYNGGVDFSSCSDSIQWYKCRLVHLRKHYLWQDGVSHEQQRFDAQKPETLKGG